MDSLSYILIFSLTLLLTKLFLSSSFNKKYENLPPSPPSLPIIGHLHLIKKPLHQSLSHLSSRYGPILLLRFGIRRVLLISSLSLAEECFTKNDIAFANRPRLLSTRYLSNNNTTVSFAPYGPHWRNLRRVATLEIFSSSRLQSFSAVRSSEVRSLVQGLFRDTGNYKRKVELKSRLFESMLNVMLGIIAGKRYDFTDKKVGDAEEAARFKKIIEEGISLIGSSYIGDFLPALGWLDFQGLDKKLAGLRERRDNVFQALVEEERNRSSDDSAEREQLRNERKSLICALLSLQKVDPHYYTDEVIRGMMSTLFSAGTDTTALTTEWAMSLLLNNPKALKKAQYEIDACVNNDRLLEESDLSNLPYLQNIIIETLRMYPAAPLLLPHELSEDCTIGGFIISRGTMLLVNARAIQRDTKYWPQPDEFKPERFEGSELESLKTIPFGMGRRKCPGAGLAIRMVGLALGSMIQCFEWERVGEEEVDMMDGVGLTSPRAKPLEALCTPRKFMVHVLSQL